MSAKKALKALSDLDLQAKKDRYKAVPPHALPKAKFTDKNANGLTKAILSWLTLNGHYASRIQSQGQYNHKLKRWTKSTVKRGIGDVMAVIAGRSIMIEVKTGKDRQSVWQKKTQEEVNRSGGLYFIAKDFDSFMVFYKGLEQGSSPTKT
jgi:hypothetical protein